jgi:hypothetical protein
MLLVGLFVKLDELLGKGMFFFLLIAGCCAVFENYLSSLTPINGEGLYTDLECTLSN